MEKEAPGLREKVNPAVKFRGRGLPLFHEPIKNKGREKTKRPARGERDLRILDRAKNIEGGSSILLGKVKNSAKMHFTLKGGRKHRT